jgi:hypothetical protein
MAASKRKRVVKYIGTADVRIIDDAQWDKHNGFAIPVDALGPDVLSFCEQETVEFLLADEAEEPIDGQIELEV